MTIVNAGLDRLRSGFLGEVIVPGDPAYGEARSLYNAMIDVRPRVIAQCANAADVAHAIRFARDAGLAIGVRGGGHGVAGKALVEDGLVIDLRPMHAVSVDPAARQVTVGGGATMSHLDRGTEPYGLAAAGGRVSTTGVGGYTLGGGDGWLARKLGLACDNLVAVELVTAEGEKLRASEDEHAELFWALHGGGGNFGVATSFTFRLHELPTVTVAMPLWKPEAAPELVRLYRDFLADAPDEVGGGVFFLTGPELDFVPEHLVGKLAFSLLMMYAGPEERARKVLAPLLDLGHEGLLLVEVSYAEMQCMFDDPPGYRNYWSAEYLGSLPDEAVERFCARAYEMVVPSASQHVIIPGGGAQARGPADYPLPWRKAPWCVHPFGLWMDPADDARGIQWARDVRRDCAPWATGNVYLNFIGDEGQDRVVAGFGPEAYSRLARIKAHYDPENVFRSNHNIKPAVASAEIRA